MVGSGGVGSAIAASAAAAGTAEIALCDVDAAAMQGLGERLRQSYPDLKVSLGSNDPSGFDVVVNATPLGTYPGDPMPLDVSRLVAGTYVAEVVMKHETTAFLARGAGAGLQDPGRNRHAVRADPRLSRILRLPPCDAGGAEGGGEDRVLKQNAKGGTQ